MDLQFQMLGSTTGRQLINVNGWVFALLDEPAYRVDRQALGKGSYLSALYQKGRNKLPPPTQTATVVDVWRKVTKMTGWGAKLTEQTPLWKGNYLSETVRLDGLQGWSNIGTDLLGDMWKKGKMLDFAELQTEYQMGGGGILTLLTT